MFRLSLLETENAPANLLKPDWRVVPAAFKLTFCQKRGVARKLPPIHEESLSSTEVRLAIRDNSRCIGVSRSRLRDDPRT